MKMVGGHSLERQLFIVGFDAAHVVRRGGVERVHQQRQGAAELPMRNTVNDLLGEVCPEASRDGQQTRSPYLPPRFSAADWLV